MRQSLPDLALELSMDGIILHQRTAPGQWAELGATRIDAPDLGANLRAMRAMADTARGQNFRTQIWLPDEQVSTHNLLLTGETQKEREQSARNALSAITPHQGEDFTIVLGAPSVSGYTPVAAVLLQTLKEARVFAESNGFRPIGFSSRQAPSGFDFTPAFTEPPDYGPLKRKLSYVAGLGLALLIGGIGFRVADPYDIWITPPQEVAAPLPMPDAPTGNELRGLALMSPKAPGQPALQPADLPTPVELSGSAPAVVAAALQPGALVAAPDLSAPGVLPKLAAWSSGPLATLPTVETPEPLYASAIDLLPAQKSPRFQPLLREPVAPAFVESAEVQLASYASSGPVTTAPGKFIASIAPATRNLPNPAVTRAFPLDNLETIIAAAKNLGQTEIVRRAAAGRSEPATRTINTAAVRNDAQPRLSKSISELVSPDTQPAATLPEVGQIASLRPLRRPASRPPDLQTEGEFERPTAEPNIQTPPPLALVVPPDIDTQPDDATGQDTPPVPPLTDVAWLSKPLSELAIPAPARPAKEAPAAIAQTEAQRLPSPAPGELPATVGGPAEPIAIADAETETTGDETVVAAPSADTVDAETIPDNQPTELVAEQSDTPEEPATEAPDNRFSKFADRQPRPRPESIQQLADKGSLKPTQYALLSSVPPKERPATLELKAAAATRAAGRPSTNTASAEAQDEPEATGTTFASIPTSATVQRAATVENAFDLSKLSLIGVYGSAANRRALIRLPSGRFVRVQPGDKFGGYQVASIGSNSVNLLRKGKSQILKMPK